MNGIRDLIFYHSYPLGMLGAPSRNNFDKTPINRFEELDEWLYHIKETGCTALYIGPLFESTAHGYDTKDFCKIDRRLGTNQLFAEKVKLAHNLGIKVILDAVFNHTGRDFFAFQDILKNRENSPYTSWYRDLDFNGNNEYGDSFSYTSWNGCNDLPALNLNNQEVRKHLIDAAIFWIKEFNVDGLRLDAADCLTLEFIRELKAAVKAESKDFFLIGEIIHGDYRKFCGEELLDSVTNYECYKGLYSSHNDKNYHEIAWSLKRQFGAEGIYKDIPMYNFADNHDVARIASTLKEPGHLYPLHILLFTMPGAPSVYYGSEWAVPGEKINGTDITLRPHLDLHTAHRTSSQQGLQGTIQKLAWIRNTEPVLRYGEYSEVTVENDFFVYTIESGDEKVTVAVNCGHKERKLNVSKIYGNNRKKQDLLNSCDSYTENGSEFVTVHANWGVVVKQQ